MKTGADGEHKEGKAGEDGKDPAKSPANRKKSGQRVEFQLGSDVEKHEDEVKITILEPQQIIELLSLLDRKDDESKKKVEQLRTPLTLLRNEMGISESSSPDMVRKSLEDALLKVMKQTPVEGEDARHPSSSVQMVHQPFTDKLICIKDSYCLK